MVRPSSSRRHAQSSPHVIRSCSRFRWTADFPRPSRFQMPRAPLTLRTARESPTARCSRSLPSGRTIEEERSRRSRFSGSAITPSRRFRSLQTKSNDADPLWMADTVYFRSDRNGEFNIFSLRCKDDAPSGSSRSTPTFRFSVPRPALTSSSTSRPAAFTSSILKRSAAPASRSAFRRTLSPRARAT